MSLNIFLLMYFIIINFITFLIYVIDKQKAKKHKMRISEKTLLSMALIGGAFGALLAMYIVRHKTRKAYFVISVPLMLIMHIILIFCFIVK